MFKFKDLNRCSKSLEIIFQLSNRVSNLNDYFEHRDLEIDFKYEIFNKAMTSHRVIERTTEKTFFYNRKFIVRKGVFNPRWESEYLIHNLQGNNLLDMCCGSGVLGITLALQNPHINELTLIDISEQAIQNTIENCEMWNIPATIIQTDWIDFLESKSFDNIIANFPYVSLEDHIQPGLIDNDPHLALFADWEHYRKLIEMIEQQKFDWKTIILEINPSNKDKWDSTLLNYEKEYIWIDNSPIGIILQNKSV